MRMHRKQQIISFSIVCLWLGFALQRTLKSANMKNLAITLSLLATLAFARISAQDAAAYVQQTVSG